MPPRSKSQPKRRNNLSIEQLAQQQQQQQAQPAPNPAYVNLMNRIQAQGGILGDFAHMSLGEILANNHVKKVSAYLDDTLPENGIGDYGIFTIDLNDGRSTGITDLDGGRITLFSENNAWVQAIPNGSSLTRYADGSWRFVDKSDKNHMTEYTWDANQQVAEAPLYPGLTSNLHRNYELDADNRPIIDKNGEAKLLIRSVEYPDGSEELRNYEGSPFRIQINKTEYGLSYRRDLNYSVQDMGWWEDEIARPDARIRQDDGLNPNPVIRADWQQLASALNPGDPPEFYDIVRTGPTADQRVSVSLLRISGDLLENVTLGTPANPESIIPALDHDGQLMRVAPDGTRVPYVPQQLAQPQQPVQQQNNVRPRSRSVG